MDGEVADVEFVDNGIHGIAEGRLDVAGPTGRISRAQVKDHGALAVGAGGDGVGIDGFDGRGLAGMDEAVAVVAVAQVALHRRRPRAFRARSHGDHARRFGPVAGAEEQQLDGSGGGRPDAERRRGPGRPGAEILAGIMELVREFLGIESGDACVSFHDDLSQMVRQITPLRRGCRAGRRSRRQSRIGTWGGCVLGWPAI